MFDFRYHALSLAAVLLALAVGVLLGVVIGDAQPLTAAEKARLSLDQGDITSLKSQLNTLQSQASTDQTQLSLQAGIEQGLSQLAVSGKLAGLDIGLLFFGQSSDAVAGYVREAVTQAGGQLALVATVNEPLDLPALGAAASGVRSYEQLADDPSLVQPFGNAMGRELSQVLTPTQLLPREQNVLLNIGSGQLEPLQGVVIVRDDPSGMSAAAAQQVADLESGIIAGLHKVGTPTVGGELTTTTPSEVPWYSQQKMPSVDDLDEVTGRVSLVYELTGYNAALGEKPSAAALLPQEPSSGSGT